MARHPSRLFDIDIFDTNFMEPQKEVPKDSIDYNLLTKSQQRFIHKQLKELKRVRKSWKQNNEKCDDC